MMFNHAIITALNAKEETAIICKIDFSGRIGQAIARRANAFGIQVHYHNRNRLPNKIEENLEATFWESLDQMLARIDFLSINAPHTPSTFHLINSRRLKLMKKTSPKTCHQKNSQKSTEHLPNISQTYPKA